VKGTPPLNPPSMGEEVEHFPSRGGVPLSRRGGCFFIRHPEPSLYEGVRISFSSSTGALNAV